LPGFVKIEREILYISFQIQLKKVYACKEIGSGFYVSLILSDPLIPDLKDYYNPVTQF